MRFRAREPTAEREIELLRLMSPDRKLAVMRALIQLAYDLKTAWIRAQRPELSEEEILVRVREQVGGAGP
jgi:hypothetical protein